MFFPHQSLHKAIVHCEVGASTLFIFFLNTYTFLSSVVGTAALVFYTFPYLGIIFVPMIIFYYMAALYYRASSVETKRLDSLLRSLLYASYSGESRKSRELSYIAHLTCRNSHGVEHRPSVPFPGKLPSTESAIGLFMGGIPQDRFVSKSNESLDQENRAYYMTIAIQRWLGVRLDILGNILILGICLFAAGFRGSVDPSKIGVVLSYTLSSAYPETRSFCCRH